MFKKSLHNIDSGVMGPKMLIFGGIHGNEPSGVNVIERFVSDLVSNQIQLLRGSITLAIGNLNALQKNQRYIDKDMNRMFVDDNFESFSDTTEFERVKFLKSLFKGKDVFLDLHSASSKSHDFLIAEPECLDLAAKLNSSYVLTGWSDFGDDIAGDTENYGNSLGIQSLTYEAGQHVDPLCVDNSYEMILKLMSVYNMIDFDFTTNQANILRLSELHLKTDESQRFEVPLENFLFVSKGQMVINGENPIVAKKDSYLIFPVDPSNIKIGEELCFLAEKI